MIDRQYGCIAISCDECDENETSEKGVDFSEFWQELRRKGWTAKNIGMNGGAEWVHFCPGCSK